MNVSFFEIIANGCKIDIAVMLDKKRNSCLLYACVKDRLMLMYQLVNSVQHIAYQALVFCKL